MKMEELKNDYSVNEKLRSFTDMALREAHRKKKEMVEKIKQEISHKKKDMEIHLLEDAYRSIQTGTRQSRKELNEEVSKALVNGKRKMFDKRKQIIEDVFRNVIERVDNYKKTGEYRESITKELKEAMELLNEEAFELQMDKSEKELFEKLTSDMDEDIKIVESKEKLNGGFVIYGKSKKKRVDCSYATRLVLAREEFLEMCRIPIEDGDLLND
jgi:vacuolar-type H+-ATPase subunit E/Vma4